MVHKYDEIIYFMSSFFVYLLKTYIYTFKYAYFLEKLFYFSFFFLNRCLLSFSNNNKIKVRIINK